jgi:hypothetical protein
MTPSVRVRLIAATAVLLILVAAGWLAVGRPHGSEALPPAGAPQALAAYLEWGAPLEMEENERVINVTPRVTFDPRGGFLVADGRESQVRRYRADGRIAQVIGRMGNGPGEFRSLVGVHRLKDGRIVALEMGGKVSIFDESGEKVLGSRQSGLVPLYESAVLADNRLLLAGRRFGTGGTEMVHIYNVDSGALERSMLDIPRHDPGLDAGYSFAGSSDAAARGDTVAAVFALTDSVYLFGTDGSSLGRIAIPFEGFRRLKQPMPTTGTEEAFREWSETFSSIGQLFWLRDGSFLVQYYDMAGVEPQWRLLHMSRNGQRRFEGMDVPKLLATRDGEEGDELLFVHPDAEAPNRWVPARVRR